MISCNVLNIDSVMNDWMRYCLLIYDWKELTHKLYYDKIDQVDIAKWFRYEWEERWRPNIKDFRVERNNRISKPYWRDYSSNKEKVLY